MEALCHILDADDPTKPYSSSLNHQINKFNDASLTPSARILNIMKDDGLPFFKFALKKSQEHQIYYSQQQLSAEQQRFFDKAAEQSHKDQQQIESADTLSFDDYLKEYFSSD